MGDLGRVASHGLSTWLSIPGAAPSTCLSIWSRVSCCGSSMSRPMIFASWLRSLHSLSARSWSRPTCFAIARSLVRPMPKLVSPPVRSPISFQFASPRASRFPLSRSRTSVLVMGRVYCRLILGSEPRGRVAPGEWASVHVPVDAEPQFRASDALEPFRQSVAIGSRRAWLHRPLWSNDGRYVIYVRSTATRFEVARVRPGSATPEIVASYEGSAGSRGGSRIPLAIASTGAILAQPGGGTPGLFLMRADYTEERLLTSRALRPAGFSKDGREVIGLIRNPDDGAWQLWSIEAATGRERQLGNLELP